MFTAQDRFDVQIQTKIEDKLSELILEDKVAGKCKVDYENDEFTFLNEK